MSNDQAIEIQTLLNTALPALKSAYRTLMPDDGASPHPDDDEAIEMIDNAVASAEHVHGLAKAVTGAA